MSLEIQSQMPSTTQSIGFGTINTQPMATNSPAMMPPICFPPYGTGSQPLTTVMAQFQQLFQTVMQMFQNFVGTIQQLGVGTPQNPQSGSAISNGSGSASQPTNSTGVAGNPPASVGGSSGAAGQIGTIFQQVGTTLLTLKDLFKSVSDNLTAMAEKFTTPAAATAGNAASPSPTTNSTAGTSPTSTDAANGMLNTIKDSVSTLSQRLAEYLSGKEKRSSSLIDTVGKYLTKATKYLKDTKGASLLTKAYKAVMSYF